MMHEDLVYRIKLSISVLRNTFLRLHKSQSYDTFIVIRVIEISFKVYGEIRYFSSFSIRLHVYLRKDLFLVVNFHFKRNCITTIADIPHRSVYII